MERIKDAAINLLGKGDCLGCYACLTVCPKHALKMELDEKGFLKPYVLDICIRCGKCQRYCPVLQSKKMEERNLNISIYGGWSLDENNRMLSSSGGLFTEIARLILADGGVVAGACWDNGIVSHCLVFREEDLFLLRGSKYLQSRNLNIVFEKIKEFTDSGRRVLFSGTPCQVKALKSIVKSNYLYTIDLVCLGIPSYKVFEKHLREKYSAYQITKVNFRSKIYGWKKFALQYFENENLVDTVMHRDDDFYRLFNGKFLFSNACVTCQLNLFPRQGDISLADYWGVDKLHDSPKGVSIVISTTDKGNELIERLQKENKVYLYDLEQVAKNTSCIERHPHTIPDAVDAFWHDLEYYSLKDLANKYVPKGNFFKRLLDKFIRFIENAF